MDFKELISCIKNCNKCDLSQTRTNVVIGRGSKVPKVVFIGEAPGEEEDKTGRPFAGKSGKLLDEAISTTKINDYAIINIVKCRPPDNRVPTKEEIEACSPWLNKQLELLHPDLVVLLGATALNHFFPKEKISKNVGKIFEKDGMKFLIFYHPAYILRNMNLKPEYIKRFESINFFLNHTTEDEGGTENKIEDIPKQKYVPLHVHTEYGSLITGMGQDVYRTSEELAEDLYNKGFVACAITDHGKMSGIPYTQDALKKRGIKPIVGVEEYLKEESGSSHVLILVKNEIGYQNLLKIRRLANENFYRTPRIDINDLCEYHEGLIVSSACISGFLGRRRNRGEESESIILKLKESFGDDFYLEVMPNRLYDQQLHNKYIMELSNKYNIKMIITTDSHYNNPEDKKYHDIVKAIGSKKPIEKSGFSDDTFCNLTDEQICELLQENHPELYKKVDELFINTLEVAYKCNFEIPENLGDTLIGSAEEAQKNILESMDVESYINKNNYKKEDVESRIKKELDLIFGRGYDKYFDTVLQMIKYAREHNIPCGPGRGSVGGSLVAYLLGITKVDPLRFDTMFERFISPTRTPDIDMDFSAKRRKEIIGYLVQQYGSSNVAQIITFDVWKDKQAFRDVSRVFGVPLNEVNIAAKELSNKPGKEISIEDALATSDIFQSFAKDYPDVIDAAIKIKGKVRHSGIHAAGVVICSDLPTKVPVEFFKNTVVTSWEKNALEKMGIVKFDILGLKELDIIDDVLKYENLTWDDLPLDFTDPKIYNLLQSGKTFGVFQLGTKIFSAFLKGLKPTNFEDLIATNALCRPGPLNSGMAAEYSERKNGKEWEYYHPILEPITKRTLGIFYEQEQIMQIANQVAGFPIIEAEKFMKLIAKSKGAEALKEKQEIFYNGARANGLKDEDIDNIFNKILEFGRYSFNRSHSTEYSMISYWTAFLKCYYPQAIYTAMINNETDTSKITDIINDATDYGIKISPPAIESPSIESSYKKNTIYLGLGNIKGIGENVAKKIVEAGENFTKVKSSVPKKIFTMLAEIGYFDSVEPNRKLLVDGGELYKNTLLRWSDEKLDLSDWSEEEKIRRIRKHLPWPRSNNELKDNKYNDLIIKISDLEAKKESLDNKAVILHGWIYGNKSYEGTDGKAWVLEMEDGSGRIQLNISPQVYKFNKNTINDIIEDNGESAIIACVHPYYLSKGEPQTRDSKVNLIWMGRTNEEIPENIINGMDCTEKLHYNQYVITNIHYGMSKKGNRFASLETLNSMGNLKRGVLMLKDNTIPKFGQVISGMWEGDFFKPERIGGDFDG